MTKCQRIKVEDLAMRLRVRHENSSAFTIFEVAAEQPEKMVSKRIMRPSIVRAGGIAPMQLADTYAYKTYNNVGPITYCALILLRLWRYISYLVSFLLTYLNRQRTNDQNAFI